jgi:hypothetical protein
MRRTIVLFCLLTAFLFGWSQKEMREGYCVTTGSDTLNGKFLLPLDIDEKINLARLQWKIYFLTDNEDLTVFKPDELKSFHIKDSLETYHFYSLELYSNNFTFVRLLSDGYMRLYVHYAEVLAGGWDHINFTNNFLTYPKRSEEDYFIVKKPGEELVKVRQFSMVRKLSEYISENEDLAFRIIFASRKRNMYFQIFTELLGNITNGSLKEGP